MVVCMAGMRRMGSPPDRTEEPQSASTADRIATWSKSLPPCAPSSSAPPSRHPRPSPQPHAPTPTRHPPAPAGRVS
jgi:hypothetical protein